MQLDDTRNLLLAWGRFWRWKEGSDSGYAPVSPSHQLIELARLGCMIQSDRTAKMRSDEIRVPRWVEEIDGQVSALPPLQRAALVGFYIRSGRIARRRVKSRALLRAEIAVSESQSSECA